MKEIKKIHIYCAVVLSAVVAITFIAIVINMLIGVGNEVERTTQAQTYNLQCLTEPTEKPLEECKEQQWSKMEKRDGQIQITN